MRNKQGMTMPDELAGRLGESSHGNLTHQNALKGARGCIDL